MDMHGFHDVAAGRDRFLAPFLASGFTAVEPAILQPADVFLDLGGEDLAKRLFLTSDASGRDLCLRPELTIPICLDHIAGGEPARRADYACYGRVFRHRPEGSGEFWQGGVESIGRADTAGADADVLAAARDCASRHGLPAPAIRIGDTGLFRAALAALELPAMWRRRLSRAFGRGGLAGRPLAPLVEATQAPEAARAGVLAALSGTDRAGARALVADLLSIGGLSAVGGRTVGEIADRFLEQADLAAQGPAARGKLPVLEALLAVSVPADRAVDAVAAALAPLGAAAEAPLAALDARHRAFRAAGLDLASMRFEAAFGRRLDYYTGLVFELSDPTRPEAPAAIGGGRYDALLALIGAPAPVPAIGFAAWPERMPGEAR
jgi:ATP phosphoribosyltransferase regulatory subunit